MSESSNTSSGGFGVLGAIFVVFLVFLVFKLAEIGAVASWSWWWVLSPFWAPAGVVLGCIAVYLVSKFVAINLVAPIVVWRSTRRILRQLDTDCDN